MIMSLAWNDNTNMLAALADGKFTAWYYPSAVYVDRDLLPRTSLRKKPGQCLRLLPCSGKTGLNACE
ncbi:hypothetical protein DPMN_133655 [Dreissena polymorpha]|uniref:IFT80 second beta-propeller domain-containing protein n=1 Tax=Dreissena polymorpha TaxID=45954 RepID=A0A9D4JE68_DREPO|nr:hypothetical protein DPMN_133655 [Dreissena polymorpha]